MDVEPAAAAVSSRPDPTNEEEEWWSIEYAVAVAVSSGDADALERRRPEQRGIAKLRRRVAVSSSGGGWRTRVVVARSDGVVSEATVDAPLGHPAQPATNDDLCGKWQRITGRDGASVLARLASARADEPFVTVAIDAFGPDHPAVSLLA